MNVTTGPYFDGSGLSVLRESVIVVVDILGYEEEVKRTSKDGQSGPFLESLHPVLSKSFRIVDDATGMKWFAKMMTDNLLVSKASYSLSSFVSVSFIWLSKALAISLWLSDRFFISSFVSLTNSAKCFSVRIKSFILSIIIPSASSITPIWFK